MIGVVTTSYPRTADDGAGAFVRERVRRLFCGGHEVEIVAAGDGGIAPDHAGGTRIRAGTLFYRGGAPEALEEARLGPRLAAWGEALGFSLALLGELVRRRRQWDAVESHWLLPCGLLVSMALPGLPHRAHVHGGDLHLLARLPWGASLGRVFCQTRPHIVFASADLHRRFVALVGTSPEALGARCRVEAAPFDASLFRMRGSEERRRLRQALGLGSPTVLAVGRLVPIKGFDVLLAAVASMPPASRPDLVVVGEGPQKARLAREARTHGIRLRLTGHLGQAQLADVMAAADLFVHPCRVLANGRSEGMPLVVREALACGLPVVASASGGLRELGGTQGLTLVEPEAPERLAALISASLGAVR